MRYPGGMSTERIPDARYPGNVGGENSGCEISGECWRGKILDARHPDGMSVEKNSGCEISRWNELCHALQGGRLRVQGRGSHTTIFREDHTYTWVLTMS